MTNMIQAARDQAAWLTQAAYEKAAAALGLTGENSGPCQAVLGMGLDTVLQQAGYEALVVYGLAGNQMDFVLTKGDLEPLRDVVDSFCILYAAARGAMPPEKARELMAAHPQGKGMPPDGCHPQAGGL